MMIVRNLVFASLCSLSSIAAAEDGREWIGRQVMPKENCRVMDGARVVNERAVTLPMTVVDVRDGWLDVGPGYVKIEQVVRFEDAAAYYTEVLQRNPNSDKAHNQRAAVWHKLGELEKAIADYDASIRLDPRDSTGYANRGAARDQIGDHAGAIRDYEMVIRLDPQSPWGYNGLAWLRATCPNAEFRDGKQAVELATRASRLSGDRSPYCFGTLAAAYAETGDFAQAVRNQRKAIGLYSGPDKRDFELALNSYLAAKPYRVENRAVAKPARSLVGQTVSDPLIGE